MGISPFPVFAEGEVGAEVGDAGGYFFEDVGGAEGEAAKE